MHINKANISKIDNYKFINKNTVDIEDIRNIDLENDFRAPFLVFKHNRSKEDCFGYVCLSMKIIREDSSGEKADNKQLKYIMNDKQDRKHKFQSLIKLGQLYLVNTQLVKFSKTEFQHAISHLQQKYKIDDTDVLVAENITAKEET